MRKNFLHLLATVTLAFNISGCQTDSGTAQTGMTNWEEPQITIIAEQTDYDTGITIETTSSETPETVQETLSEKQKREWAVRQIISDNLFINGAQIALPCSIDSLPQGFSLEGRPIVCEDMGSDVLLDNIMYSDTVIAYVFYYDENSENANQIYLIDNIRMDKLNEFELYGISKECTIEQAENTWGDPDEIRTSSLPDRTYYYYFEDSDDEFIKLIFDENGILYQVSIDVWNI